MAGKAKRPESVSAGTEKRNEGTTGRACEEKCPDGIKSGQRAYQERRRKNDRSGEGTGKNTGTYRNYTYGGL